MVFGAGGRAGRAVTAEAVRRGHAVTGVVRDVAAHGDLASPAVTVRPGDVTDAVSAARLAAGHDAAVGAVTPATGPEALAQLARFDDRYFVKAADALLAAGPARLVVVGLFATLLDASGRLVMDDPAAFPAGLRRFARAHLAGLDRLRQAGAAPAADWLVLTPTAALDPAGARTGTYRLGGDTVPAEERPLSYADLAVAVVDEIEAPTRRRTRAAVHG
ncbi:NAD(P)H-binding protein [Dactylosporangium fulvum]